MVDRDVTTSDGYSYTVTSEVADWTADELRTASDEVPDEIATRYDAAPERLPAAGQGRGGRDHPGRAPRPTTRRSALQNYFRSGRFTYDKQVGPGHSNQALMTFLFETRRGYCEQFVGRLRRPRPFRGAALAGGRGLHPGRAGLQRPHPLPGAGRPRPRLARGVPGRVRVGAVRTDGRPRPAAGAASGSASPSSRTRAPGARRSPTPTSAALTGATPGPRRRPATSSATPEAAWARVRSPVARPPARPAIRSSPAWPTTSCRPPPSGSWPTSSSSRSPSSPSRWCGAGRARAPADRVRLGWRTATEGATDAGVRLRPWMTIAEKADAMAEAFPAGALGDRRPRPPHGRGGLRRVGARRRAGGGGRARRCRHPDRDQSATGLAATGRPVVRRATVAERAEPDAHRHRHPGRCGSPGLSARVAPTRWAGRALLVFGAGVFVAPEALAHPAPRATQRVTHAVGADGAAELLEARTAQLPQVALEHER